jgi:hypothetical protein
MVTAIAVALPPIAVGIALALVHTDTDGGLGRALAEAGSLGLVAMLVAAPSLLACMVLVALSTRGRAVPVAVLAFLVALPWWIGLASMRTGMGYVLRAVAEADYVSRTPLLARGFGEALEGRVIGAALAGAMAIGVGLALAVGSRPRDDRSRTEALAASVLVLALGWVGVVAAYASSGLSRLHHEVSSLAQADRIDLLEEAVTSADLGGTLYLIGGIAVAVAAIAVASNAAAHARPTAGRVGAAVALGLVAVATVGLDLLVVHGAETAIDDAAHLPWVGVAGFQPTMFPEWVQGASADAPFLLGTNGLAGPTPISTAELATDAGRSRAAAVFRAHLTPRDGGEEAPEWLRESVAEAEAPDLLRMPAWDVDEDGAFITLVVDARVPLATLGHVTRAIEEAGASHVTLIGINTIADPIRGRGALVEALTTPLGAVEIALESAVRPGAPDADETLYHATIGASPLGMLTPRAGSRAAPITFRITSPVQASVDPLLGPRGVHAAYLALGSDATMTSLSVASASIAQSSGVELVPVLCLDGIPGHPDAPIAVPSTAP